tara:strand:+ start:4362 stop:4697 length:336 start_codon:yes stop_codon:yes gene_type:complete
MVTSREIKLITALIVSVALNIGLIIHVLKPVETPTNDVADKVVAENRKERNKLLKEIIQRDIREEKSRQREDSLLSLIPNEAETIKIIHEDAASIPDTQLLNVVHDILADE